MLGDLVDGALHLSEEVLPQTAGLLLVVKGCFQQLILSGPEQTGRLHLILS
jgi:hypothetical protein